MALLALAAVFFWRFPVRCTGHFHFTRSLFFGLASSFAACLATMIVRVARIAASGPSRRFTPAGFAAKCYGLLFIPRTEVEEACVARIKSSQFLGMKLRKTEAILHRMTGFRRQTALLNRKLGFGDVSLAATGMNPAFPPCSLPRENTFPGSGILDKGHVVGLASAGTAESAAIANNFTLEVDAFAARGADYARAFESRQVFRLYFDLYPLFVEQHLVSQFRVRLLLARIFGELRKHLPRRLL